MIDFVQLLIPYQFTPEEVKGIRGLETWTPAHRRELKLKAAGWTSTQRAIINAKGVQLGFCPQHVLGELNAYGSSDLQEIVKDIAPRLLAEAGLTNPVFLSAIEQGTYTVRIVHIAYQFQVWDHSVYEVIEKLFDQFARTYKMSCLFRGHGFEFNQKSRHLAYMFYDAAHKFMKEMEKEDRRKRKSGAVETVVTATSKAQPISEVFRIMKEREHHRLAESGPRLEMRFGPDFFRKSKLKQGSDWLRDTAENLYKKYLKKLAFPKKILATLARTRAKQLLAPEVFQTFLLWSHGEDMRELGISRSTLARRRAAIKNEMGIDILKSAKATLGKRRTIDCDALFNWDNRTIPFSD